MRSIILSAQLGRVRSVYSEQMLETLRKEAGLDPELYSGIGEGDFSDVDYIFSTWGMPSLSEEEIARVFPSLKAVFYAAGSVQGFAGPFLARGIRVFSAWAANAVPVCEFTVSQILLANKGFFGSCRLCSEGNRRGASQVADDYSGNYGAEIGIIGVGMIGTMVARKLREHDLKLFCFDPFLKDEKAEELGVVKIGLDELFSRCSVVTNHLANNAQTRKMLTREHFLSMKENAVFINTGRGAQVDEAGLIEALRSRPDLTALLDVTDPEPPAADSPFYSLPNCFLTPHIAGSKGEETKRMAEYMLREFRDFVSDRPTRYGVSTEMLKTMA